jgi:hypothetical protein
MNYVNYESSVVEKYGVSLTGWPLDSKVQNPGGLGLDEGLVLRNALGMKDCRWVILTEKERDARKAQNVQRERDGEQVYIPRKKRLRKSAAAGDLDDDDDDDDTTMG